MKYSEKEQDLIECIDKAITELVYEKVKLIKAYNYYHGKRDPEQFRHLEENYRYSYLSWICSFSKKTCRCFSRRIIPIPKVIMKRLYPK